MAAGLESRTPSAAEATVERQLADTCNRMRWFDIGASALVLGSAVGAYAIAFAVFDLSVQGADAGWPLVIRWLAYVVFLAIAGVLSFHVLHRLTRHVNPYYAARRLEATVPDAKNSLISWLDLRDEPLPPALRKTLGGKAAHDIDEADPEQAIERGPTWVRLAVFAAILLGVLVLFAARPGQFFSLMRRAFFPFHTGRLVEATRITMIRPETGDVVVVEKQALVIVAQIDGRVPDVNQPGAPALYYRYQAGDKFVSVPLQQDGGGTWTTRLLPDVIGGAGLSYKLVAGDAQTPVYQVTVRAQPFVERYEITYRYRPYLNLPPEQAVFPNQQTALPIIKRHRGTEVTLVARTNRPLRQASATLTAAKTRKELDTHVALADLNAFRTQWVLDESGDLYVSFTSVDGEVYRARVPIPVEVLSDEVPTVMLTRPAQNVEMPANGTLEVEGVADDDLGLKELTLRLEKVEAGKTTALASLPYQRDAPLDLDGKGTYPVHLDYLGIVKLDELRGTLDLPVKLQAGAVVRYWLEARDNSDYPNKDGNVGKSKVYEIKIKPPADEEQQKAARDQAVSRQQQHAKAQKQKLDKQKEDRQNAGKREGAGPDNAQKDKAQKDKVEQDVKNQLNQLDKQAGNPDKGAAKGNEPKPGETKSDGDAGQNDAPSPQPKDQPPSGKDQTGDSKDGSQSGSPQPGGGNQQPGQSKDAGGDDSKGGDNPSGGGGPQNDPAAGAGKDGPKQPSDTGMGKGDGSPDGAGDKQSAGKDGGPKDQQPMPGAKGQGEDGSGKASGQSKPGGGSAKKGPGAQPPQGTAKGEEANGERSISKEQGQTDGKASNDPRLKADAEKNPGQAIGVGKGEPKTPPRDQAKEIPGLAKGDEQSGPGVKQKTPTAADVEHMKDLMQRKDNLADVGVKALEKMSKEAPDPKVRESAKQALDEAGTKTAPGAGSNSTDPNATGKTGDPKGGTGEGGSATGTSAKPPSGAELKNGTGTGGASGTKSNTGRPPTGKNTTPGAGAGDDITPDPARKDLARFGGNLQLEDFIQRATPEYRAKHGISEADWQRFLTRAAQYDALLRKLQARSKGKTTTTGRALGGGLGSVGPTPVTVVPGAAGPTDSGQAEAPPELVDALNRFRNPKR